MKNESSPLAEPLIFLGLGRKKESGEVGYFLLGSEVYITVLKTLWKMFKTPQGEWIEGVTALL